MASFSSCLLMLVALSGLGAAVDVNSLPRQVGSLNFKLPAFAEIHESADQSVPYVDRLTLYVSTFNPFAFLQNDPVYFMRSPGRHLYNLTEWPLTRLANSAVWPNSPDDLPSGVVPGYEGVIWSSGFLVPTKTKGRLEIFNMNAEDPTKTCINIASKDTKDYAYHRVLWKDMDGDGDMDAVTARFHNANKEQSFAWMENPGEAVDGWTQHEIYTNGPDVNFVNLQLQSNGVDMDCFLTAELWHLRTAIYCIRTGVAGGWTNPENVQMRVIDDTVGQAFDVLVDDLNNDGRVDLLLTAFNNSRHVMTGNVLVYEIPDDIFEGQWVRHVIADGFKPAIGNNKMSPGAPKTFYPSDAYANEMVDSKPHRKWIAVSGDDDGHAYVLRPRSDATDDWSPYEKSVIVSSGGETVGTLAIGDMDADGYTDMIISGYSANKLFVYTYKPE